MNYPIYTDQLAAIADWFMARWKAGGNTTVAKVCYLNNDSFGRSVPTTAMTNYLQSKGFQVVLPNQEVSSTPTTDPTAVWEFIIDNDIDLVLGAHTCIGSVPLMKWATQHQIGYNLAHNVTFGFCSPSHLCVYLRDQENPAVNGNGLVVAGSYPCFGSDVDGVQFAEQLQALAGHNVTHIMYLHGVVEAMIQVEAFRLALLNTGKQPSQLTSADVLHNGFQKIAGLDTGGIIPTTITYGTSDIEGADAVIVHQNQNGAMVTLGTWPLRHVY
jgi:ABC-type branched-subunit amino acid transport system substrate-binding protein